MASFTKAIAAGAAYAQIGFLDSNGFLIGSNVTAPSQGATGSGMYFVKGIKSAPMGNTTTNKVQITGDGGLIGEFTFPSLDSRSFIIEIAVQDLEMEAKLLGTTVETLGEIKLGALDVEDPAERNCCLLLQGRAKKQDSGVIGQTGWTGALFPLCTVFPLGRDSFNERDGAVFRYEVTPQTASNDPWGISYIGGTVGKNLRQRPLNTEYPVTLHAHIGTGALSTFTLDKQPISASKTSVISNRVKQTTSSVSTSSPYSVTISGTPIGGANLITVYEFAV